MTKELKHTGMQVKSVFVSLIFILGSVSFSMANLSFEGLYQGKSLFVENPVDEDGFGYCITKVTVNKKTINESVQTAAFEISFEGLKLKIGDPVFIEIEHGSGCKPRVLNPEVLLPKSTFKIEKMTCTEDGDLKWQTKEESGKLTFMVEQFRWNKWVTVGEVKGKGTKGLNSYSIKITPHSGENKVRVSQIDHSGKKRVSEAITFVNSKITAPAFYPKRVNDIIKFTNNGVSIETRYEIFDAYGNIVKKGVANQVDCSNLKKGAYYINYDNKSEKFIKG